jgi:transposase
MKEICFVTSNKGKFEYAKKILEKYKIKLSLKSIGKLLAQLGLTCQKPLYKAIQQELLSNVVFDLI